MEKIVMQAPAFSELMHSDIDPELRSVSLTFRSETGEEYLISLQAGCLHLTLAALAGRLGELQQTHPTFKGEKLQPIEVQALEVASKGFGDIGLLLHLKGGGVLQLGLPEDFVASFSEGLMKMEASSRQPKH